MNGGNAEASADICIVEAAEAEILRNAKTDRAAGEENQLGDPVVFGDVYKRQAFSPLPMYSIPQTEFSRRPPEVPPLSLIHI